MDPTSWPTVKDTAPRRNAVDVINDYRARLALEEQERAQRRRLDLDEQRSNLNPPNVRIRAWEKVHGLRLPSDAGHAILEVIAADTRLTLAQVHEEQQARRSYAMRLSAKASGPISAID